MRISFVNQNILFSPSSVHIVLFCVYLRLGNNVTIQTACYIRMPHVETSDNSFGTDLESSGHNIYLSHDIKLLINFGHTAVTVHCVSGIASLQIIPDNAKLQQ